MTPTAFFLFTKPFLSNLREYVDFMEAHDWPSEASNFVNASREYPHIDKEHSGAISTIRAQIISESDIVIAFTSDFSASNPIQDTELGIAIASPQVKKIHLIGPVQQTFHRHPKITAYSTWENFVSMNFLL